MDFGFREWLRDEMDTRGWSELEMAVRSDLTHGTIHAYLHGKTSPTLYSFINILDALGKKIKIIDAEEITEVET